MRLSSYSFVRLFFEAFMRLFVNVFKRLSDFVRLLVYQFFCLFVFSFKRLLVFSFTSLFVYPSIRLLVYSKFSTTCSSCLRFPASFQNLLDVTMSCKVVGANFNRLCNAKLVLIFVRCCLVAVAMLAPKLLVPTQQKYLACLGSTR